MMAKADRPLREYWDENGKKVAAKLEEILEREASRKGAKFKNLSAAATFGASELTKFFPEKGKPFSPSTLTRNNVYRKVILDHLGQEAKTELSGSERLKFQLELKQKDRELAAVEKQLVTALEDRSKAESRLSASATHTASQRAVEDSFKSWKRVIDKLLRELEGAKFNLQERIVEDPVGVNRVLLKESDFPDGFFDWLKRNGK